MVLKGMAGCQIWDFTAESAVPPRENTTLVIFFVFKKTKKPKKTATGTTIAAFVTCANSYPFSDSRERERKGETEKETERGTERERQTDRQTI